MGHSLFTNLIRRCAVSRNAWRSLSYMVAYLAAIIAANLVTARVGQWVTPINALIFIGLDITSRDILHDAWHRKGLVWKMGLLIATGSILSWLLNRNAGRIALASFVAFAAASIVDALVYHLLRKLPRWKRVNGSNLVSAAVDSVIFPALAFGWPPDMEIVYGMSTAKVAGGLIWSVLLMRTPEQPPLWEAAS